MALHDCRAAASANTPAADNNDKLKLQLRQAQQMAAAVARKKDDMMIKLKRLTDKQVHAAAPHAFPACMNPPLHAPPPPHPPLHAPLCILSSPQLLRLPSATW